MLENLNGHPLFVGFWERLRVGFSENLAMARHLHLKGVHSQAASVGLPKFPELNSIVGSCKS